MNNFVILLLYVLLTVTTFPYTATGQILDPAMMDLYINRFNKQDKELYAQHIPNRQAKEFLAGNIPLFECPDKNIEEIYYFRWWTFRKHLKKTLDGFIVTEFLPDVPWAGKHNGICCPAWFHFQEGRWLKHSGFLKNYAYYWLKGGGNTHSYSFPITHAIYQYCMITGNYQLLKELYPELLQNYSEWEKEKFIAEKGLFWQKDGEDGMEVSIGGHGFRATINSYMAAEADILSKIAHWRNNDQAQTLETEACRIKENMLNYLWDSKAEFFKVLPIKKKCFSERRTRTTWIYTLGIRLGSCELCRCLEIPDGHTVFFHSLRANDSRTMPPSIQSSIRRT